MALETFIERHKGGERAILVHMDVGQKHDPAALAEFCELSDSASVMTLDVVTGSMTKPSPKYFVGTGKADQIQSLVQAHEAEVVLFNHELTPAQGRNLENLFQCRVLDRTELILDIFAQRARTYEGKLQVELAQLQHLSTCLIRGWTHLERQKGGIGLRGPGETQLESDRRMVGVRIKRIRKRLEKVQSQREQNRHSRTRANIPTISLVGYTNAGKSTLFNRLTESNIFVADQLFATLDPTVRRIEIPDVGTTVLADTVGFIRDLPHDLVAAFRATLEETRRATLLLHVVDSGAEDYVSVMKSVDAVLEEIGAEDVPQLVVMNKIDLVEGMTPRIDRHEDGKPKRVWMSAQTGKGAEILKTAIAELIAKRKVQTEWVLEYGEEALRAKLYDLKAVQSETIDDEGRYVLQVELFWDDYNRLLRKL